MAPIDREMGMNDPERERLMAEEIVRYDLGDRPRPGIAKRAWYNARLKAWRAFYRIRPPK